MKLFILVCVGLVMSLFYGCSNSESTSELGMPKDWRSFSTVGGYVSYIIPFKVNDGTQCLLVTGNSTASGRAITCNWK